MIINIKRTSTSIYIQDGTGQGQAASARMGKVLDGTCVSGTEVLWVALHGFAFGLMILVVGVEHLNVNSIAAIVAGGATYLLGLSELTSHSTLQDWMPLVAALTFAGFISKGGSRYSSGKSFVSPTLAEGLFPTVFLAVLGGFVMSAFHLTALKTPGIEEWIPLMLAASLAGLFASSGARLGSTSPEEAPVFFPQALTSGTGPRSFLLGLGLFVGVSFLNTVNTHKGEWEQWVTLAAAAGAVGLLASGGVRYAQGGEFFPESLVSGPVPTAIMALLGAFVYTALNEAVGFAKGGQGLEEWMPLALTATLVGVVAMGGSRVGQDLPFFHDVLSRGYAPILLTLFLGAYTILSLHAVTEPKGGLTLWMNLAGAATIVGGLSFYGQKLAASEGAALA